MSPLWKTALSTVFIYLVAARAMAAEPGVSDRSIHLGMVSTFTGPVGASGHLIRTGYEAAFARANESGGVFGRKIELRIYDDKYNPADTVLKTNELLRKNQTFALIGYNGTSTVQAALPLLLNHDIPFLFPRTGVPSLRPFHRNIINSRPSFASEIAELIKYSLDHGRSRIAIFFQQDAFGDALREATLATVQALHGTAGTTAEVVAVAGIDRETTDAKYIEASFSRLELGRPDTVILATSLAASAPLVKLAVAKKKSWEFLTVSSTNNLADQLNGIDVDLVCSQVVPFPTIGTGFRLADEFNEDMKRVHSSDRGLTSFEAYLNGRTLVEAIRRSGTELTRKKLIRSFEASSFLTGGLKRNWSPTDHNGRPPVYLMRLNGKFLAALPTPAQEL